MAEKQMLVYASSDANSNKFYEVTLMDNGEVVTRYGRVGETGKAGSGGSGRRDFDSIVRSKMNKGYKPVEILGNVPTNPNGAIFEDIAVRQIAKGNPLLEVLVRRLSKENVHNILQGTALTYNQSSGQFSTPLGLVSRSTINRARQVLHQIRGFLESNLWGFQSQLEEYMILIPMDVGRGRFTTQTVFPNIKAVERQEQILDALEASIDTVEATAQNTVADVPSVFKVDMSIADAAETQRVIALYTDTSKGYHASSRLSVKNVWHLTIGGMAELFRNDGAKMKNRMELWHGTRTANLLSILSKGLIVPKSAAHGRMFGDGLYFSDQSTKSLNYAYGYWSGTNQPNCFMFLAQVGMGNYFVPRGPSQYIPHGYDSFFAKAGESGVKNNEMIVPRVSQANITHLVEFGE